MALSWPTCHGASAWPEWCKGALQHAVHAHGGYRGVTSSKRWLAGTEAQLDREVHPALAHMPGNWQRAEAHPNSAATEEAALTGDDG
jgi:hypothetical protein